MEIIGNLFLNRNFKILPAELENFHIYHKNGFIIRIFCKQDRIDSSILVFLDQSPHPLQSRLIEDIENYKILQGLSRKRVFLQIKKFFENSESKSAYDIILKIPFITGHNPSINGLLILTEKNLRELFLLLNVKNGNDEAVESIMKEENLRLLDKAIYQRLSTPPDNFAQIILSLSDHSIQTLLNHFLHKGIASTDMLASYIYDLGDKGKILIENLSRSVKQEIIEKVKTTRLTSTYRWADEVSYIINRNIFISARELEIPIREMKVIDFIRKSYEITVLKHQLQKKGIEEWLLEFGKSGRVREIINNVKRRVLTEALSFAQFPIIKNVFSMIISRDGIKLLIEDIESSKIKSEDKRMDSLILFFREIKNIYFTPFIEKLDFENEVLNSGLYSGAIDLIIDEIGFAKVVFALKNMPVSWIDSVLKGVIKDIYEDVLKKKIRIIKYDDYRIRECRLEFLKALYILSDEEKI